MNRFFPVCVLVLAGVMLGVPSTSGNSTLGSAQATAGLSNGERRKVEGTIVARDGNRITVRVASTDTDIPVELSNSTQFREKKSNPFRRGRKYYASQLSPGLTVEVDGHGDNQGALVADKIRFTNDDLKMARSVDARVSPIEQNERRMSGQIAELDALSNAARGGAKAAQETADAAHSRISALDDYQAVDKVTVRFRVGSAALSDDARRSLDALAQQAKSLKGFVIEVAGFASSEGGVAINQRLSRQRAEAVSEYLVQKHDIPLRRIMSPAGYGTSHPVSNNSTRAGRQENRRVEVRVLVSRGITAQASDHPVNPRD